MKKLLLIFLVCLFSGLAWAGSNFVPIVFVAPESSNTVSYVGSASGSDDQDDGCIIPVPSGTLNGHRMFAWISSDTDTTMTATGWTLIHTLYQSGVETWVYYRDAGSSEPESYTFTAGAASYMSGHIVTVSKSGGTWADPTGSTLNAITGDSSDSITTSSVTATSGSILLCGFGNDGLMTVSTAPNGMTLTSYQSDYGGCCMAQAVYYQTGMSAGAVTKSITWSASDGVTASAVVVGLQ